MAFVTPSSRRGFFWKRILSSGKTALFLLYILGCGSILHSQELKNPGFETYLLNWSIFDPQNAKAQGAVVVSTNTERYDGNCSVAMETPTPQRFGINQTVRVAPKDRYRISAWVKGGEGAVLKDSEPGVYLRAVFLKADGKDSSADARLVGLSGKVAGRADGFAKLGTGSLPKEWTMIQCEVEVPDDATSVAIALFSHGVTGRVYWDYVSITKL